MNFVSQASLDCKVQYKLRTKRRLLPVKNTRGIGPRHMVRNQAQPEVKVDPKTHEVTIDGKKASSAAVREVPMNMLYFLT